MPKTLMQQSTISEHDFFAHSLFLLHCIRHKICLNSLCSSEAYGLATGPVHGIWTWYRRPVLRATSFLPRCTWTTVVSYQ